HVHPQGGRGMKSIRISLILYFLLLLAGALGAVSFLVYRTTAQALEAKQETNKQLLKTQYDDRRQEEMRQLDKELLDQAQTLARLAQAQVDGNRPYRLRFAILGPLTSATSAQGHVTTPLWLAETMYGRLSWQISRAVERDIVLNEDLLHREDDN